MNLCVRIIEYHGDDGESVGLEKLSRLSYTRRYNSLVTESVRDWGMLL
jgi:hypothetical protein